MHLENYGIYAELVQNNHMVIQIKDINKSNWDNHYNWILNIMKDSIETDYCRNVFITVVFKNGMNVDLSIIDYWFNLIMWYLIIATDSELKPKHIFFDNVITGKHIKKYIDKMFLDIQRKHIPNIILNNIIDNCMSKFADIDLFSMYLSNTINLHDFILLMNQYSEFNDLIHADLSNVPIADVKHIGMEYANKSIEYIKNSNHCLSNFFKAGEGVSDKQYKEVAINIGSKPDGQGGVYPAIINTNFITGGVNDLISFGIESSVGRTAQIIVENNTGDSGYFARLLGLNNTDTFLNHDPNHICNTKNFQEVFIENEYILNKLKNRYYRLDPNGMEYLLKEDDIYLIGKTIYLRSPMTCASASAGKGICHRCYGDLSSINNDINIGKLAAELLSSILTQMMLSAKHLLESDVIQMQWVPEFEDLFMPEYNTIKIQDSLDNLKKYKLVINVDNIETANEENDQSEFNDFITNFDVQLPNGNVVNIHTAEFDQMFLTTELRYILDKKDVIDDHITVDFSDLENITLFSMIIYNNDLSKTLKNVKDIIDNAGMAKTLDRNSALQTLLNTLIVGGLNVDSVHVEIILMNQLRNIDNILETPKWEFPNEPSKFLTLHQSLKDHPSLTIGLSFESVNKMLYNPLTYSKHKPSFMDLFFMVKPQEYLHNNKYEVTEEIPVNERGLKQVIERVKK